MVLADSRPSKGSTTAMKTGALEAGTVVLEEEAVMAVTVAHDESKVDLRWVLKEKSKHEARESTRAVVALVLEACDPPLYRKRRRKVHAAQDWKRNMLSRRRYWCEVYSRIAQHLWGAFGKWFVPGMSSFGGQLCDNRDGEGDGDGDEVRPTRSRADLNRVLGERINWQLTERGIL